MRRVEAVPVVINGKTGYDIVINDSEATVQDYIDAVERFIEENRLHRLRAEAVESCFGCDLCCRERIPFTVVDACSLTDMPMAETLEKLLHVYVEGRVVDITMGMDESGGCPFLDGEKHICRNYRRRPLVCRTFICCPSTKKAKRLRSELVNTGEDELVRAWFGIRGKNGQLIMHEAAEPEPDISDYRETAFSGATDYSQVKIKAVCPPELWRNLVKYFGKQGKKKVFD